MTRPCTFVHNQDLHAIWEDEQRCKKIDTQKRKGYRCSHITIMDNKELSNPKSFQNQFHLNSTLLFFCILQVAILENGKPVCNDVGVFPHPGSCRKFVTCSRRAVGSGIVGWVYECPSYLAFDPVGGRCNWANEFVCAERRY